MRTVKVKNMWLKRIIVSIRLIALWILVFLFVFTRKDVQANQQPQDQEKKDKVTVSSKDGSSNNSFLFVDCTGFFE
ncbi:MAG: hypothetical protein A2776_01190 [Candidatus Levybacteria bacterium RIFCSPHIGHO2_01_FULL_40_10]|nr:MAG: hypothetical protein A2776_01190 [Candidatus Levybacteria bacterium RIFCSPHIGHO2_01_FULL_40_10]